jgi:nitroreductase
MTGGIMVETWDAIRARRNVRTYKPDPVPEADDHDVAFLIGLGYPADHALRPIIKPDRRPFDEVVRRGHW